VVTVARVAAELEVTPRTVRDWIAGGSLPAFQAGRHLRIYRADLEAFIAAHRAAKRTRPAARPSADQEADAAARKILRLPDRGRR
jgi:excisionase family DNA binding protein